MMNSFPTREQVERIRKLYTKGTRIEVTRLEDPYSKLTVGSRGNVENIDDCATLFCVFDNGEHLGLLYGIDGYRKVEVLSDKAIEGLLHVRSTGRTNMLDLNTVSVIADELGYHETIIAIYDNKRLVTHFVMTGETEL